MRYLRTGRLEFDRESGTYLGHPTHGLARNLVIRLKEKAIYSGELLRVLSLAAHEDRVFPMVRKLTLLFIKVSYGDYDDVPSDSDDDDGDAVDPATVEANVSAFLEQLKLMAPMVSEIIIENHSTGDECDVDSRYFGSFISRLFQPASRISFSGVASSNMSTEMHLDGLRNLTHIQHDSSDYDKHFLRLIHQNVQTLQSLDIDLLGFVDDSDLIQDPDDDRYVAYPRLLKLRLGLRAHSSRLGRGSFKGAVPFPCLLQLHVW